MRPKRPTALPGHGVFDFAASRAAESVPRPIAGIADSLKADTRIPAHAHKRAQLIFAIKGTMTVQASSELWTLPPSHALWVPAGMVHEIRTHGPVEMRTLYIEARKGRRIRNECHIVFVSPLLRELIVRAIELPALYDQRGMEGRVMDLIVDEIALLPARPLGLRMPRDPRLLRLCERLFSDLAAPASIARLGACVGLSERSVIRLFPRETGLSFVQWHNQARLLRAFELFDQGHSVTRVAMEIGYSSPGAFAKMFRRALGQAPLDLLKDEPESR